MFIFKIALVSSHCHHNNSWKCLLTKFSQTSISGCGCGGVVGETDSNAEGCWFESLSSPLISHIKIQIDNANHFDSIPGTLVRSEMPALDFACGVRESNSNAGKMNQT